MWTFNWGAAQRSHVVGLVRRGTFAKGETILFWHTGGTPALHAYGEGLLRGAG